MATESPGTAFGLSLAGGVMIFIAGLILAALASFAAAVTGNAGILAFGWFGSICGIAIIALAVAFHSRTKFAKIGGALVIVFALVSIPFTFGGFVIGFILAIIGGILAIIWKPAPPPAPAPAQPAPVATQTHTIEREVVKVRCRYCGNLGYERDGKCPSCGASL